MSQEKSICTSGSGSWNLELDILPILIVSPPTLMVDPDFIILERTRSLLSANSFDSSIHWFNAQD